MPFFRDMLLWCAAIAFTLAMVLLLVAAGPVAAAPACIAPQQAAIERAAEGAVVLHVLHDGGRGLDMLVYVADGLLTADLFKRGCRLYAALPIMPMAQAPPPRPEPDQRAPPARRRAVQA